MTGKRFIYYYLTSIYKPGFTFEELLKEKNKLHYAFAAIGITAILYTLVYVFLIYGGGLPYKPWLDIPAQDYYRYNVFFCAPSMFLAWIFAGGLVQLICHMFNGEGSFEQTLVVMAFGISLASWATGIHDIVSSFLGAIHVINQNKYEEMLNTPTIWRTFLWVQMGAYLLGFAVLFSEGIKVVHKIRGWQAIVMGLIGFVAYQGFFFIFNR